MSVDPGIRQPHHQLTAAGLSTAALNKRATGLDSSLGRSDKRIVKLHVKPVIAATKIRCNNTRR